MPPPASERLATARAAVERACLLLLSPTPEQLDASARLLQSALSELESFRNSTPSAMPLSPAVRQDAFTQSRLLRVSIAHAAQLLESAASYWTNWVRCLGALCAGYTHQGQPAAVERDPRLLAQG